ncbi:MAG: capsular biosynthesis protein, partial [Thermoanaerobacteraceae bacterium]|nr:capsular biosynthesis protein [Thermoanaerobacteraceae bacterium]
GGWEYDIVFPGYKCNMTDIMASLGLSQLQRYPTLLKRRREIIELYNHGLKGCNIDILEHFGNEYSSNGHLYMVRLNGKNEAARNHVIIQMAKKGIATNVHFKPLPLLTAYKKMGFNIEDYPNAYEMYKNEISLPMHTQLTDEQIRYVVNCLEKILEEL